MDHTKNESVSVSFFIKGPIFVKNSPPLLLPFFCFFWPVQKAHNGVLMSLVVLKMRVNWRVSTLGFQNACAHFFKMRVPFFQTTTTTSLFFLGTHFSGKKKKKTKPPLPKQESFLSSNNNVLKDHTKTLTTQNHHHHHHHVWCIVVVVVVGTAAPGATLRGDRDDGRDDQRVRVVAVRVGRRVGDFETFEKENDGETLGG